MRWKCPNQGSWRGRCGRRTGLYSREVMQGLLVVMQVMLVVLQVLMLLGFRLRDLPSVCVSGGGFAWMATYRSRFVYLVLLV